MYITIMIPIIPINPLNPQGNFAVYLYMYIFVIFIQEPIEASCNPDLKIAFQTQKEMHFPEGKTVVDDLLQGRPRSLE